MPKLKDWQPGEVRLKIEIVDENGAQCKAYLPHSTVAEGEAAYELVRRIMVRKNREWEEEKKKEAVSGPG